MLEGIKTYSGVFHRSFQGRYLLIHTEKCEKYLDFFSTLKVCCWAGEEQNGSEIMCQECENKSMSWMLNHLSVTMAQGFCSVCQLPQTQTEFLKCRGSSTVHSPSLCSGIFGSLVFPLLHDSEIPKVFLCWGLWFAARVGSYREQPWMFMSQPGTSVCVTMFTPWRAASVIPSAAGAKHGTCQLVSLTVEHLPSLNQCLSFSSSHLISAILILLYQVVFLTCAGSHPLLQQEGSWK